MKLIRDIFQRSEDDLYLEFASLTSHSGLPMITADINCYRCGASLASLSLPLSRQDACPSCSVHLHVCKMCEFFDQTAVEHCREEDAEAVSEKERANFCEWFKPAENSFDAKRAAADDRSRGELAALFDTDMDDSSGEETSQHSAAEDLFK